MCQCSRFRYPEFSQRFLSASLNSGTWGLQDNPHWQGLTHSPPSSSAAILTQVCPSKCSLWLVIGPSIEGTAGVPGVYQASSDISQSASSVAPGEGHKQCRGIYGTFVAYSSRSLQSVLPVSHQVTGIPIFFSDSAGQGLWWAAGVLLASSRGARALEEELGSSSGP